MKYRLFITSICLLIAGIIGYIYAATYSYVDANNVLHDTIWLPISAIMLLLGVLFLLASTLLYCIAYYRKR